MEKIFQETLENVREAKPSTYVLKNVILLNPKIENPDIKTNSDTGSEYSRYYTGVLIDKKEKETYKTVSEILVKAKNEAIEKEVFDTKIATSFDLQSTRNRQNVGNFDFKDYLLCYPSSSVLPIIVGKDMSEITDLSLIKSGALCNVEVSAKPSAYFDKRNQRVQRVGFTLGNIQLIDSDKYYIPTIVRSKPEDVFSVIE